MKPYDKLTIFRNRHRARDLRIFRELVVTYFERSYDGDDLPVDWGGVQAARSEINQMLLRVIQVVRAAGVDGPIATATDSGPAVGDVEALQNIFSAGYADGGHQDVLDVIDLALGVYENSRLGALARTVNPFHYVVTALAFAAGLPRRIVAAFGFRSASGLADAEKMIEARFAQMRDRQAQQFAETSGQLVDLAERVDFAERVLARQRPLTRLESPNEHDVVTPTPTS